MKWKTRSLSKQAKKVRQLEQSEEWLLIVLDACRYDRLQIIFDDYFKGSIEPIISEGYNTFEYVRHVWPEKHDITYVTGAAPINGTKFNFDEDLQLQGIAATAERLSTRYNGYRPVDHIDNIVEVWRTDWDEELGVCPPEPVSLTAKKHAKTNSQLVVHYFQPHVPYIGKKRALGDVERVEDRLKGGAIGHRIWERARDGEITYDRLLELYDSNLQRVLESVCWLIQETDFKTVVIMGDHGEALGELGIYGHPELPHPYTRIVPWSEIHSARKDPDINYELHTELGDLRTEKITVEERLESLGYI